MTFVMTTVAPTEDSLKLGRNHSAGTDTSY